MKKPRLPTMDEIRLWRATTRHDLKYRADATDEDTILTDLLTADPLEAKTPARTAVEATASPGRSVRERINDLPVAVATGRAAQRLLRAYGPVEATLDLHGMGRVEAYGAVHHMLERAHQAGQRHVLIITGKGRLGEGILRAQLPHWLNEPGLRARVVGMAQATPNNGGSGVYHVILKRIR